MLLPYGSKRVRHFIKARKDHYVLYASQYLTDTFFIVFRQYDDGSSFVGALSKSATTESTTATDVATNSNMQVLKCAVDASNAIYSINGVTKVTKTTNLPTAKMQPKIRMDNVTDTGLRTVNIRYCEAYNT